MMRLTGISLFIAAAAVVYAVRADADTVHLANGDRLTGTVISMVEGALTLGTSYAGTVELGWNNVARVSLDKSLPVILADGREVSADELPAEGLALADVAAVAPPLPPPPPPVRWKGRADFGYGLTQGNRDAELGTLTVFAERKRPERYRFSLLLDAAQGSSEGEETANRARLLGKFDRMRGASDYRYFLLGGGYDKVRDINSRLEAGAGLGLTLVETRRSLVTAEAGASYLRDEFENAPSESDAKLRLGESWQRQMGKGSTLRQTLALLSTVGDLGDYNAEFVLALTHALSDRLSLTSRLVNTYDSRPAPGTRKSDFTFTTQVGLSFGS